MLLPLNTTSCFLKRSIVATLFLVYLFNAPLLRAQAQSSSQSAASASQSTADFESITDTDASVRKFTPWQEGKYALGDWGGWRKKLAEKGIEFGLSTINEVWGNTTGGLKTGSVAPSLIQFATGIDLEKLIHWKGASFYSRWAYLGGQDPGPTLTGDLFGVSNIAGWNTFRNIELWLQQNFLENKLSVRAGQLVADSEFVISDYGALFINNTFGWPAFLFTNLPFGGPAFPMGAPGVRIKIEPSEAFSLKAAVFQGVYSQQINNHGFYWDFHPQDGLFYLLEAAHRYQYSNLPGQIKTGVWGSSGNFLNTASTSNAFNGNYGVYGIIDQLIYCPHTLSDKKGIDTNDSPGLGAFGRVAFEPSNLNLMSFYFDTGLNYKGLFPKRKNDLLGIGVTFGQMTSTGLNNIQQSQGVAPAWIDMIFELTYQAQITRFVSIQPDLQYIINPGTAQNLPNALIIGMRANVTF